MVKGYFNSGRNSCELFAASVEYTFFCNDESRYISEEWVLIFFSFFQGFQAFGKNQFFGKFLESQNLKNLKKFSDFFRSLQNLS